VVKNETFVEKNVTYTIMLDDQFVIIENVPARVCLERGERLCAPETVERLQEMAWKQQNPSRLIQTPVFEFTT